MLGIYSIVVLYFNIYLDIMCHANFTEAPGSYQSPFYPNNYPTNVICETRMTAPVGYRVYLTVCSILYVS